MQILDYCPITQLQVALVRSLALMGYPCMMRHLNSQHYHNLQTDQTVGRHLHQKVDLPSDPLVMQRTPITWVVMAIFQEHTLPSLGHLREECLLEAHTVVPLHLEAVWDLHYATLLVQEVGKGQLEVLYILDPR